MRDPDARPSRSEALLWTVGVSVLWIIVYGACNWISSLRSDVRTIQFGWERHIPLIPWLIVPYMSIDLFFVGAPFLCTTRRELHTLVRRLAGATLLAGLVFLMVPMTLAGERPTFEGWPGAVHDFLKAGDRPYNLFPSLHATLTLLLWPVYHRHARGLVRPAVHAWFALMLLSILPVYQHHFIDVAGGAALATLCVLIFPEPPPDSIRAGGSRRLRLAARYALAAAPFLALAIWLGPWGLLPAWIGAALVVVATAYALADPGVFHKRDGRLGAGPRLFLFPHLAGLGITRRHYFRRTGAPWARIGQRLIVGRWLDEHEAELLLGEGVGAVIDLTAEHDEAAALLRLPYLNLPVLDLTAPGPDQCRRAAAFAIAHVARGPVYIHCGLGLSRSATIAAACLLALGEAPDPASACDMVTRARPHARFGPREHAMLESFTASLRSSSPGTR